MVHQNGSRAQEILATVRISDVWTQLGGPRLRKTGASTYRGRAFWRDGDGENVSLNDSRGAWFDFVSSSGGGILELVAMVRGCSRADALRWCADLAGIPLEDKPLSPEQRVEWARERQRIEQRLPDARLWVRGAIGTAEDLLHALKTGLFDPTAEVRPKVGEIRNLESLLSCLRRLEGTALVSEYESWRARYPVMVDAMVETMRRRDRAERRALLAYLQATEPEVQAA